jgi:tetratricopeptide (TPR) repeat protein
MCRKIKISINTIYIKKDTMINKTPQYNDLSKYSFYKLCDIVTEYLRPYEDVAEFVEAKAYEECVKGNARQVIDSLQLMGTFFETMENKNDEQIGDIAEIYLLAGELCQYSEWYNESISWFEKSIIVNDRSGVSYHSLAISYLKTENIEKAILSLEQEIALSPGNYYSYLMLADLYENQNRQEEVEKVLQELLSRDSDNIQALHKLICHYRKANPDLDVTLLRKRLINADKHLVKLDLVVWTFHLCFEKRYKEALHFLIEHEEESQQKDLVCLLKAHTYGCLHQYAKRRMELAAFREKKQGRTDPSGTSLMEFRTVFGDRSASRLGKIIDAL